MISPSTTGSPDNLAINLPPTPISARQAREFVQQSLHSLHLPEEGGLADNLGLVASELVTNAILHAGTEVQVRLSVSEPGVTVEVIDGGPVPAPVARPAALGTSGRGLLLVDALSDEWGVSALQGGRGKRVWARLSPL